ncbi:tetratricopeptide repeat protein [Amycolatopsis sp. NPDC049688]|uniref:ATP-binding protein n=1 Tax=Amycolatopsis sp. NPDC049688 TaxID=3154733 RepID=UPI00344A5685
MVMTKSTAAVHRTIVVVDVEGFGAWQRTNHHQLAVRRGLYSCLRTSFDSAGIPWESCETEDRGDGVLILAPPEVPKSRFVESLPALVVDALAEHNDLHGPEARIRLRLAVHAGEINYDDHGVTAASVNLTFRLANSSESRAALAGSRGILALITSNWFFDEVVRHSISAKPDTYRNVTVSAKETVTSAWIALPDNPYSEIADPARQPSPAAGAERRVLPVPRHLPASTAHYTGRLADIAKLDSLLAEPGASGPGETTIFLIVGAAGMGKTALAVHWAHAVRSQFTDGDIYIDLHGYDPVVPTPLEQILERVLRALGVTTRNMPADLEGQTALYRSLLADRRVLIVLDNAATPEQVRPLLPGSATCRVLITSRHRMSGLVAREGAARLTLDPLHPTEAYSLLEQIVGADRVAVEGGAATEITRACACHPLALRIAAERVAAHPRLTLAELARQLSGERDRLDLLAADDDESTAVRVVFSWSYRALPPAVSHVFRLLGLHSGPDISVPAAAALTNLTTEQTRRNLDALASVHLVEEVDHNRYRLHDLLRLYAAERASEDETEADRRDAKLRLLTWYLHSADSADRQLAPRRRHAPLGEPPAGCRPLTFDTQGRAWQWCEAERLNLVAATRQASAESHLDIAWQLPTALWGYFTLRTPWVDWISAYRIGLAAAEQQGARSGYAWLLAGLGIAYRNLRRYDDAIDSFERALDVWRELGDRYAEAWTLGSLSIALWELERFTDALACSQEALTLFRAVDSPYGESQALHCFGDACRGLGRYVEAIDYLRQALHLRRRSSDPGGEAQILKSLGDTHRDLDELDKAEEHYRQALGMWREVGDRWSEARSLTSIGDIAKILGNIDTAVECWRQALAICEELGAPQTAEIHARLEHAATASSGKS